MYSHVEGPAHSRLTAINRVVRLNCELNILRCVMNINISLGHIKGSWLNTWEFHTTSTRLKIPAESHGQPHNPIHLNAWMCLKGMNNEWNYQTITHVRQPYTYPRSSPVSHCGLIYTYCTQFPNTHFSMRFGFFVHVKTLLSVTKNRPFAKLLPGWRYLITIFRQEMACNVIVYIVVMCSVDIRRFCAMADVADILLVLTLPTLYLSVIIRE